MEESQDIRWKQRFQNYIGALKQLKYAATLREERPFTSLEMQGAIQAFEVTQELSWKVMKDFLEHEGYKDLFGSKTTIRMFFQLGLISDGETWMRTIESRNKTSHIYDENEILEIIKIIFDEYLPVFVAFEEKMKKLL